MKATTPSPAAKHIQSCWCHPCLNLPWAHLSNTLELSRCFHLNSSDAKEEQTTYFIDKPF